MHYDTIFSFEKDKVQWIVMELRSLQSYIQLSYSLAKIVADMQQDVYLICGMERLKCHFNSKNGRCIISLNCYHSSTIGVMNRWQAEAHIS